MTFRRVIQFLGVIAGLIATAVALMVAFTTKRMVAPARQSLWADPADMGMEFENVDFPAQDSVRLSGWFIPAAKAENRDGATVIFVHDWTWNRLGDAAADVLANLSGTTPVELLRLAHALHNEGFNILMYDQRNHGESAPHPPVTFGLSEANDFLGAVAYLRTRPEVDKTRIGAIGFSMGANAILYALPQTDQVGAAIAVQPMTIGTYAEGYAEDLLGMPSKFILPLVDAAYAAVSGVSLSALQPGFAAAGAGSTPVLFVQCKEDRWGSLEDADRLRAVTPVGEGPLYVDGDHRYQGYQYMIENPRIAVTFFERYF